MWQEREKSTERQILYLNQMRKEGKKLGLCQPASRRIFYVSASELNLQHAAPHADICQCNDYGILAA